MNHLSLPTAAVAAILLSVASAQSDRGYRYEGINIPGASYGGGFRDVYHAELFVEANQRPNATRSVEFTPFYLGTDGLGSPINTTAGSNVWTWRVNVTDFAVPDAVRAYPAEQPAYVDAHVTNTVWSLEWPGEGNFSTALQGSTGPVCMTTLSFDRLAPNVTNLFTENDTHTGNCAPVLGQDCVTAMLAASVPRSSSGGFNCQNIIGIWSSLPECASSFGASLSYQQYGFSQSSRNLNGEPGINASTWTAGNESLAVVETFPSFASNATSGSGILSTSTDAYNATNTTLYDQATNKLQVMVLSFVPETSGQVNQVALCMRVNTSTLPTGTSDDGSSPTSASPSGGTSSGVANANAMISTGSVVGLTGLAVLFGLL